MLAIAGTLVLLVRRGTTGKFLDAVRGSETAAALDRHQSLVPARASRSRCRPGSRGSAASLLAMLDTQANYAANYSTFFGLVWLVVVVTVSARTVEGAVVAGLRVRAPARAAEGARRLARVRDVLFGLGALTYARHPEGIFEAQKRMVVGVRIGDVARGVDRRPAVDAGGPRRRSGAEGTVLS